MLLIDQGGRRLELAASTPDPQREPGRAVLHIAKRGPRPQCPRRPVYPNPITMRYMRKLQAYQEYELA